MQFESLAAAMEMAGHGGYVWSVVVFTVVVIAYLLLAPVLRSRRFMVEQRALIRRQQREVSHASGA